MDFDATLRARIIVCELQVEENPSEILINKPKGLKVVYSDQMAARHMIGHNG